MDVSGVTSAVGSAASAPVDVATTMLKKSLDIAKDQGMALADMVSKQAGLGNVLNLTA